ncbi:TPA: hypothetical protein HA251_02005 [Candidatus Woesearchaeota archaeon]|nr:hypothetical protein [Candidatus Woesearchaeota archaeon]
MDPTPDQVLDALTERYQRQSDAYSAAVALRDKRIKQLCGTLESDVTRLHDELRGTIEKLEMFGVKMELLTKDTIATPGAVVVVEKFHDVYRVHGVKYRGKQHTVDITRRLLDFGAKMTPDKWMQRYPSGFYGIVGVPDTEIYVQLAVTLDNHEDHPDDRQRELIAEVVGTLKSDFEKYNMVTSTTASNIEVIHQWNTPHTLTRKNGRSNNIISGTGIETTMDPSQYMSDTALLGGDISPAAFNRAMVGITRKDTKVTYTKANNNVFCNMSDSKFHISTYFIEQTPGPVRGVAIRDNL